MSAEWTDEQVNQAAEKLCDLVALADALAAAVDKFAECPCGGMVNICDERPLLYEAARAYRAARGGTG